MHYVSLVLSCLLLTACTPEVSTLKKPVKQKIVKEEKKQALLKPPKKLVVESIEEFSWVSQKPSFYTQRVSFENNIASDLFFENYFRVWNIEKVSISKEDAMWAHSLYSEKNGYAENLQKLKSSFFKKLMINANYDSFATLNKKALSLKLLNIRSMPTDSVVLLDPKKAGEGFPFDYLQNSTIAPNKPLLISHYSKDGAWAFVESSFAFGWVHTRDIVTIAEKYTKIWQQAEQVFLLKDHQPIYAKDGSFLFYSRIGMLLPLIKEEKEGYRVLTISNTKHNKIFYESSVISKEYAHKGVLSFTQENVASLLEELSQSKYGWGGMYAQRDCSSTLRDFYIPFGLWLPRNSYQQSRASQKLVLLENLTPNEKIALIKKEAIPFRTLLYKKGHIVLYVGVVNDKIMIYQNVWGVKTVTKEGVEGRFIIGKPIFSTLEVGSNLETFDKSASMLEKLYSMTTF